MADLGAERKCPTCGKYVVPNANTGRTPRHWADIPGGKFNSRCPGGQISSPRPFRKVVGDVYVRAAPTATMHVSTSTSCLNADIPSLQPRTDSGTGHSPASVAVVHVLVNQSRSSHMPKKPKRHTFIVEGRLVVEVTDYRQALLAAESSLTGAGVWSDAKVMTTFIPHRTGRVGQPFRKVTDADLTWMNEEFEAAWKDENEPDDRDIVP